MIAHVRALLWRTTFVVASRTAQARTESTSSGNPEATASTRQSIPAAASVSTARSRASAKGETPIALHCPAHIGERLAGDTLDFPQLRLRAAGVALEEPGRQLGLQRDQREGLAE